MTLPDKIEAAGEGSRELDAEDRHILSRLDTTGECWLWTGALDNHGRGRVWRNGKLHIHHRAVWLILRGELPGGVSLCHHCDNPQCANPAHLYVGDQATNVADMVSRGRHWTQRDPERARQVGRNIGKMNNWSKGAKNPKAKLTNEQARAVADSNESTKILAEQYGVNYSAIQRIRSGTSWRS